MNVDASITIARPIEDVFRFVTDVDNMPLWVTGVTSAELVSDTMQPGSHLVCRYVRAMRPNEIELEVTAFDVPTRFGMKMARGPFSFEGTMALSSTAEGTTVRNSIVVDPDSLSTRLASLLFGWFVRPNMRSRLRRELETLRTSMMGEEMADA